MAYGTAKVNLAQSAENAAATAVAGLAQAGLLGSTDDAIEFAGAYAAASFARLSETWEEAPLTAATVKETPVARVPEVDDNPGATVINFGAFKGCTLEQVQGMDQAAVDEATAKNGKSYAKTGAEYIDWILKSTKPELGFIKRQASAMIDAQKAGV